MKDQSDAEYVVPGLVWGRGEVQINSNMGVCIIWFFCCRYTPLPALTMTGAEARDSVVRNAMSLCEF